MKSLLVALSIVQLFSTAHATESHLIRSYGEFAFYDSPWRISIKNDGKAMFTHSGGLTATAVELTKWNPKDSWFVYVQDNESLWAFDGHRRLICIVSRSETGFEVFGPDSFPFPVPDVVKKLRIDATNSPNKALQPTPIRFAPGVAPPATGR